MGQPSSTRMTHTGKQTVPPAPALAGRLGTALEGRLATALEGRYATALEGRLATALEGRLATALCSFARLPSTANPTARK